MAVKFEFPEGFQFTSSQRAQLRKAYHRLLSFEPPASNLTYNTPAETGVDTESEHAENSSDRVASIERKAI